MDILTGTPKNRLVRWLSGIRSYIIGGAWFFIVISLLHLAWVVWAKWSDPGGMTTLYQTTVGDETYRAWALTYGGWMGLVLAVFQLLVVSAGVTMSLRSKRRLRLAGHGILIAWSALWMFNLLRLAAIDLQLDSFCQASATSLLFGCTLFRAADGFWPRRRGGDELGPQAPAPNLDRDDVLASDELREITDEVAAVRPSRTARLSRVVDLGQRGWKASKPIAMRTKTSLLSAGGRLKRYLREKGVLPGANRSTAA